jgi:hypothetical protein
MLYDLSLHMGYIYDTPASGARHVVRVLPLSLPNRQRLIAGSLKVSPKPDDQSAFIDFFQHPATALLVRAHHERLDIRMQARVQVESLPVGADFSPLLPCFPTRSPATGRSIRFHRTISLAPARAFRKRPRSATTQKSGLRQS